MYFVCIKRNKGFPKYACNLETFFFPSLSPTPTVQLRKHLPEFQILSYPLLAKSLPSSVIACFSSVHSGTRLVLFCSNLDCGSYLLFPLSMHPVLTTMAVRRFRAGCHSGTDQKHFGVLADSIYVFDGYLYFN